MALRYISSVSLSTIQGNGGGNRSSSCFTSPSLWLSQKRGNRNMVVSAASEQITGVVFAPFEEVKKDAFVVPYSPQVSLARQNYADESEAAINEQIKFFKESSEEEREHAEKLMKFQNIRGGRVRLHSILMPTSEFEHIEKGDALYAMEVALSLEKLTNEKLLTLHNVAERNNDPQMAEFIETEFLTEQVKAIKKISEYVTQLRMVGKGHGVWHFDQRLLHEHLHEHDAV
ncbi:Ferritin/DPS protein domain [Dillenia turbinata]|uniref:Ferritin n=1 Tax=Dillenia turbinata TaxID=194707 RepID=A0AAN8UV88_9MAGN